jgi:hypothetical protein
MIRLTMRRLGRWLIQHSTVCQQGHWHSVGFIHLNPGDVSECADDFGPTVRYKLAVVHKDSVVLQQYIRCPSIRAADINAALDIERA